MAAGILVADDDAKIAELVRLYLIREGYRVESVGDGPAALRAVETQRPDLLVLDIMLPGLDGFGVLREVRRERSLPILMLTAKGETHDKVMGFDLGADDYLVKPFDPNELVARVKALLRRAGTPSANREVRYPGLRVSLEEYLVEVDGQPVPFTPKEAELLYHLATHPNRVLTRQQLLEAVWEYEYLGDSRTVDAHVKRVRQKLGESPHSWEVKTVWGVGYKFELIRSPATAGESSSPPPSP